MGHSHAHALLVAALGLGAALALAAPARAGEPMPFSGTNHCKVAEQHAIPVEGDPDHVIVAVKAICSLTATGNSQVLDGGQATVEELDDLVKGTGPVHGYYMLTLKDGSTSFQTYAGKATTTMAEGKPRTAVQLTFDQVHGTGHFANAQNQGTAQGGMASPTEAVIDFQGLLTEAPK